MFEYQGINADRPHRRSKYVMIILLTNWITVSFHPPSYLFNCYLGIVGPRFHVVAFIGYLYIYHHSHHFDQIILKMQQIIITTFL